MNAVREPGLSSLALFKALPEDKRSRLDAQCTYRNLREGEEYISEKTAMLDVVFVLSGIVRVVGYTPAGRVVAYVNRGEGEFFGEVAAIDGETRPMSCHAVEDTRVARMPRKVFLDNLNGALADAVVRKLCRTIRDADLRILELSTLTANRRVYSELLRLARPDPVRNGSWLIYPLPTQSEMAGQATTTRETVARVVSHLAGRGIVERKSKTLYIRDIAKLRKLANET